METVLDILAKNKEWLFSSIGVVVLGYCVTLVRNFFARSQPQKQGDLSTSFPAASSSLPPAQAESKDPLDAHPFNVYYSTIKFFILTRWVPVA